VTSKKDERFQDFVRRIYSAQKSIELETIEDVECMRGDVRPFELPEKFLGQVICKMRCPTCNRDFQTTIPVKTIMTSGGSKIEKFQHYEDDAGCGSSFTIVEAKHLKVRVSVQPKVGNPYEVWLDLTI